MRPKRLCPPPWGNFLDFSLLFHINLNCSKTNGRNSRTHVASCSLTDQGLMWLLAIGCEAIRLKHATLSAKLPINADNTSWGVAWMKCKGAAFLQRSTNCDETFLRGLFAWSSAEPNRNILGQDMINPKRTTQWSVMQQRNISHSMVGIVASGYAKPGRRISILICTASHCQRSTRTLLISHLLFQSANIKYHWQANHYQSPNSHGDFVWKLVLTLFR